MTAQNRARLKRRCRAATSATAHATGSDRALSGRGGRVSLRRRRIGDVAATIPPHPDVRLLGVAGEALEHAQARAHLADAGRRLIGEYALVGDGLEELADPQAAGVARRLLGRQRVVRADDLVAERDVRPRPEE